MEDMLRMTLFRSHGRYATYDIVSLKGYATYDIVSLKGYATYDIVSLKGYATYDIVSLNGYATQRFELGRSQEGVGCKISNLRWPRLHI